jgi:dUTP pyrophosphatase
MQPYSNTVMQVYRSNKDVPLPKRQTTLAAGYDLYSAEDSVIIPGGDRTLVSTGLHISIPSGYYGRIAPRSGLAVKHGIGVGAGVVDEDYRGEVKILLFNHSKETFVVRFGDRIAQLILEKIATPDIVEVDNLGALDSTERGYGGFGSTGK